MIPKTSDTHVIVIASVPIIKKLLLIDISETFVSQEQVDELQKTFSESDIDF